LTELIWALEEEAEALIKKDDFANAIPLFKKALAADPGNLWSRWTLGYSYAHVGLKDKAIAILREFKNCPLIDCEYYLFRAGEDEKWHVLGEDPDYVSLTQKNNTTKVSSIDPLHRWIHDATILLPKITEGFIDESQKQTSARDDDPTSEDSESFGNDANDIKALGHFIGESSKVKLTIQYGEKPPKTFSATGPRGLIKLASKKLSSIVVEGSGIECKKKCCSIDATHNDGLNRSDSGEILGQICYSGDSKDNWQVTSISIVTDYF
jgi:tetratricopeptide (TPR) repeat protein